MEGVAVIPLRIYAYGLIALAIGGLLWHDHIATRQRNAARVEAAQVKANYAALQAAQAHERKIANDATTDYERRLQALSAAAVDTPVRSVRLCSNRSVPATGTAASGAGTAGAGELAAATGLHPGYGSGLQTGEVDRFSDAGPELGPQLYGLMDEMGRYAAQCNALIGFDRAR